MFWVMILIILLVVYIYYRNSDSYRESKAFKSNWLIKRVEENISKKIQHMWFYLPSSILKANCNSWGLSDAIFRVIEVGQLTMGELKEIEGDIFRFYVEFENIRSGNFNDIDKKELYSELSMKLIEYLNQKNAALYYRADKYSNKNELENIKKRIDKL